MLVLEPCNISFAFSDSVPFSLENTGMSIRLFSYALRNASATTVVLTIPP